MLSQEHIQDFYKGVLKNMIDLHMYPEHYQAEYLNSRYRILTDRDSYSVLIPHEFYGTKTTEMFIEQFRKNQAETLPSMMDAHLNSNTGNPITSSLHEAMTWDLKSPETDFDFGFPHCDGPFDYELTQRIKRVQMIEVLQSIILEAWRPHFLVILEYRMSDGSLFYVLFNKEGIELVKHNYDFVPYPLEGALIDLRKIYFLDNDKSEYDKSFADLRHKK